MDFKKLADKAKETIDKRGGTDALKADAEELKKIAKGKGSLTDKAKAAASALKDPGAKGREEHHQQHPEGEMKPAQGAGHDRDTPRKGGPPHS